MSRRHDTGEPRERRSPMETVAHLTDDLLAGLNIPTLPEGVPQRLEEAVRARIEAFLFHLRDHRRNRFVGPVEIRLVREAYSAVLTACELGLRDSNVYFASLRKLLEEMGYERTEVGFRRKPPGP